MSTASTGSRVTPAINTAPNQSLIVPAGNIRQPPGAATCNNNLTTPEPAGVDVINVANSSHRGMRESLKIFAVAEALGLRTILSTTQETSLGTAAEVQVGAAVVNIHYPTVAIGPRLYTKDPARNKIQYADGYMLFLMGAVWVLKSIGRRPFSSGIRSGGANTALDTHGAFVIVLDKNVDAAQRAAQEIEEEGRHCSSICADVASSDSLATAFDAIKSRVSKLDILVNSAGIYLYKTATTLEENEWDECLDVDLKGTWLGCKYSLPMMLVAGSGSIINIASTHAIRAQAHAFPYGVAKGGMLSLTYSLAVDYGQDGVRVNAICPGLVFSPLSADYFARNPHSDPDQLVSMQPLQVNLRAKRPGYTTGVIKEATQMCGMPVGPIRPPLAPLLPEDRRVLHAILDRLGILR